MTQQLTTVESVDLSPDIDLTEDRDRVLEAVTRAFNSAGETAGAAQRFFSAEIAIHEMRAWQDSAGGFRKAVVTIETRLT